MATTPQELESLVTKIGMDSGEFMTKSGLVMAKIDEIVKKADAAAGQVAGFGSATLQSIQQTLTGLQQVATQLSQISFGNASTEIKNVSSALKGLRTTIGNFSNVFSANNAYFKNFDSAVTGLSTTIGKLATGASGLGTLRTELDALMTWMKGTGSLMGKPASELAKSLGHLGGFLSAVTNINYTNLQQLSTELGNFVGSVSSLNVVGLTNISKALRGVGSAVNAFAKVQPGGLLPVVRGLQDAMAVLNTIPVSANLVQLGNTLNQLGSGVRNLSRGGGGGGGLPGVAAGFNAIPPAQKRASLALGNFGYDMMRLEGQSNSFGASLLTLRYGLMGIGILGAYQFSQLDEALARASAHARDFGRTLNDELRAGVFGVSGGSTSSATELAKAADRLMTAGLSSTSAVRALPLIENFAVAAGLKASDAAKGLTDLMHAMDLTGNTSVEFLTNMRNVSDMLVGISRQTGSTEQEMLQAFTTRFLTASRVAKLSMEESVTILGLLSRAGEGYRGQKGGNLAARGIEQLATSSVGGRQQWVNMLGQAAYDAQGQFKPFLELLTTLNEKMAERGTEKFIAELKLMGLGGTETLNAIEPLLRVVGGIKDMRAELGKVGGVTKATADTIRTSFQSQMVMLWNNLSDVASIIGERLSPALYVLTKPLNDALLAFTKLDRSVQYMIVLGGVALVTWRPLARLFAWMVSPLTALASAFISFGTYVVSAAVKGFVALVGWGIEFVRLMHTIGSAVVNFTFTAVTNFGAIGQAVGDFVSDAIRGAVKLIGSLFVNLGITLIGFVTTVITSMLVLPPLIAAVAATVGSLGIAVGGLAALVGTGLVKAWDAVRDNSRQALQWISDKIVQISNDASSMWEILVRGSTVFFERFRIGFLMVAGLLWNFRENFATVIEFFEEYGTKPVEDILWALMTTIEAAVANIGKLFIGVGGAINAVFRGIYFTISEVFGKTRRWLAAEWDNIAHDFNMIFTSIGDSLLTNWEKIFTAFFKLLDAAAYQSVVMKGIFPDLDKRAEQQRKEAFEGLRGGFKGPFEGVDAAKFKTGGVISPSDMFLTTIPGLLKGVWLDAGEEMAKSFSKAFMEMNPIFGAFELLASSDMWKMLMSSLNFTVPTLKEGGDFLKKMLSPVVGGEGTGAAIGREGPGFTFKQSSLARFQYEGSINERIDYQQLVVLKSIDQRLAAHLAQRGIPANAPAGPTIIRTMPTPLLGP